MSSKKVMLGAGEMVLKALRTFPRVQLNNLQPLHPKPPTVRPRGKGWAGAGRPKTGPAKFGTLPPWGHTGDYSRQGKKAFYLRIPQEPYYKGHLERRQYPRISLFEVQRNIELQFLDIRRPIDITALCNLKFFCLDIEWMEYGFYLTDEGASNFCSKVNIEVQYADEPAIAAIERNGGTLTTRFYDPISIDAMQDVDQFFKSGRPIPRCKLPPKDLIEYYSDPKNRGYLAPLEDIAEARFETAQKFGYELPNIEEDPDKELLLKRKNPREIWYGLAPGSIVNIPDKTVLLPSHDKNLTVYYQKNE